MGVPGCVPLGPGRGLLRQGSRLGGWRRCGSSRFAAAVVTSCCATASTSCSFSTTYWYDDVDLPGWRRLRRGVHAQGRSSTCSRSRRTRRPAWRPTQIDFGPYADLVTEPFWELWETLFHNVWGVWRYENDLPDYRLPRPLDGRAERPARRSRWATRPGKLLVLCGGGKDSLVSMKLLERARIALRHVRLLPLDLRAGRVPARADRLALVAHCTAASRCTGRGCSTTRWRRRSP